MRSPALSRTGSTVETTPGFTKVYLLSMIVNCILVSYRIIVHNFCDGWLKITVAILPPNAKALLITCLIGISLALEGMTSSVIGNAESMCSVLMVGGAIWW